MPVHLLLCCLVVTSAWAVDSGEASLFARAHDEAGLWTVAVRIRLPSGMHAYWQEPGDSGLAPSLRWTLPEGWTSSDLRFPLPTRHHDAVGNVTYIHEPELLLVAELRGEGRPQVQAELRWLACNEVCIPGKATLRLDLTTGDADQADLVNRAVAALPTAAVDEELTAVAAWHEADLHLTFRGSAAGRIRDGFPAPSNAIWNHAGIRLAEGQLRLPLRGGSAENLTLHLLLDDGTGRTIHVPLPPRP